MKPNLKKFRILITRPIRKHPWAYYNLLYLRPRYRKYSMLVTKATDIVVEGFPRCANTFAVAYLSVTNRDPLTIARHTHSIAQIKMALTLHKPTAILIREPSDAVASWAVRDNIPLKYALSEYVSFYTFIERHIAHLVIVDFATLIKTPSVLPERLNRRFNLGLTVENSSTEVLSKVANLVESMERDYSGAVADFEAKVSRPSEKRASANATAKAALNDYAESKASKRATQIYRRLLAHERSAY